MRKFIHSLFIALSLGLLFSEPYMLTADAAGHFDDTLNPMAIAKLPACIAGNSGSRATINDFSGTVTWNGATGTGGGTGIASVYCDGGSWKVVAGGAAAAPTNAQNFVMNAPITPTAANSSGLNYASGCTGSPGAASGNFANHSCLMFDDHWTTTPNGTTPITALNLNNWYPGLMRCNGGTGGNANCLAQTTGSINYPWTSWCYENISGCQASIYLDYPLGYNANNFGITHNPMTIASDGSLQVQQKFYDNATAVAASRCVQISPSTDCTKINWIGAVLTLGGLAIPGGNNAVPNNPNALLPTSGGLMQYRVKMDIGLNAGAWNGFECDAVDPFNGINSNPNLNGNFETGYNRQGATIGTQGFGIGVNNTADGTLNSVITTGDDGVGVGDFRNWHTIAIEWSGTATHQWNWYIDGIPLGVGDTWNQIQVNRNIGVDGHNEPNIPDANSGFTCVLSQMMALSAENSFHTQFDINNPGGPMNQWISDVQVYKKPGT